MLSLFIFSWGVYDAAAFLIPVSCRSLVCTNCYTIIYGLAYCIQTQQRILKLKETENYTASDFSSNLKATGSEQFIHKISERYTEGFCTQRCMEYTDLTNFEYLPRILRVLMVLALILSKTWNDFNMLFSRYNEKSSIFLGK